MAEPPDWPDAVELSPTKIAALRVLALEPAERKRLLGVFMQHRGEDRTPLTPLISGQDQRHLQTRYEIDLDRIRSLLILIGRSDIATHIGIPVSPADQLAFTNTDKELARDAVAYELAEPENRQAVARALTAIYRYLRGTDETAPLPQFADGDPVDLIIVPGCRGPGMRLRVAQALQVLGTSTTPCRIFLSGWHPYYARQFDFDSSVASQDRFGPLPFGEADAMAAVVDELEPNLLEAPYVPADQSAVPYSLRQVLVDSRARNTLETVVHLLPVIHETYAVLRRPLRLCLVTSPYHVRRFHAITTVQLGHLLPFDETIGSIVCAPAPSGLDMKQLVSTGHPRHTDAVALYVRECFKLLGGRATGEF